MKTGTSYFGNLFPTCQQVLGHACHIWYSLWLKSLTHNHSTRAGPVRFHCVMTGEVKGLRECPEALGIFQMDLRNICKFWSLIKMHHLLVCNIINMMAYNGCSQMLHISLKTEKSFIAHPWRLLCVVGLEEYSAHDWRAATSGTARSSYLARVGPVLLVMLCRIPTISWPILKGLTHFGWMDSLWTSQTW